MRRGECNVLPFTSCLVVLLERPWTIVPVVIMRGKIKLHRNSAKLRCIALLDAVCPPIVNGKQPASMHHDFRPYAECTQHFIRVITHFLTQLMNTPLLMGKKIWWRFLKYLAACVLRVARILDSYTCPKTKAIVSRLLAVDAPSDKRLHLQNMTRAKLVNSLLSHSLCIFPTFRILPRDMHILHTRI
jgi:hypothetical protein